MKSKKKKYYTVLGHEFENTTEAKTWCIFNMKNNSETTMYEFTEDGEVTKVYNVSKRNWKVFIKKTKDYEKEAYEKAKENLLSLFD